MHDPGDPPPPPAAPAAPPPAPSVAAAPRRHRPPALRQRLLRWLPLLAACVLTYVVEHGALGWLGEGDPASPLTRRLFDASGVYGYVVSTWPRELLPRYTAVVHIDPENDPTAFGLAKNLCQQRDYLAALLPALAALRPRPATIVVDKYFTNSGCNQAAPTGRLVDAIAAVSSEIPVVVGLRMRAPAAGAADAVPQLVAPLAFSDLPMLRHGLVETDAVVERIPLGWTVRAGRDAAPAWQPSLALATAQLREPKLLERTPRLKALRADKDHPYASLIAADRFVTLQAADLLCRDAKAAPAFETACRGAAGARADPGALRGRIVVVGEAGADDLHHTGLIGTVPGTILQANYIEALLDERYFMPLPGWLDYVLGLVVFVALERSLMHRSPWKALARAAAVVGATFVLLCFAARGLGYYVGPSVGLLTLLFMLLGWLRETVLRHGGGHHVEHA